MGEMRNVYFGDFNFLSLSLSLIFYIGLFEKNCFIR